VSTLFYHFSYPHSTVHLLQPSMIKLVMCVFDACNSLIHYISGISFTFHLLLVLIFASRLFKHVCLFHCHKIETFEKYGHFISESNLLTLSVFEFGIKINYCFCFPITISGYCKLNISYNPINLRKRSIIFYLLSIKIFISHHDDGDDQ
jgi:hypothetical protein